jgi:cation:H+ antiporter
VYDLMLILIGAGLLYAGGEGLVRGASALARASGMSPMVVGLTVVAFGTSSPELAATLIANFKGAPAVAVGNVIGSNIANLGLILGAAGLIHTLVARSMFVRREIPVMIGTSAFMLPMALDGRYGRWDGVALLALLATYMWVLFRFRETPLVEAEFAGEYSDGHPPAWRSLLLVVVGIAALVGGAHLLVEGGVNLARHFGVPEKVIGITFVAIGTSLPELASAIVAAIRREGDIILGNLIGSNIFNVLAILGTTAAVRPVVVQASEIAPDYWVMMAFSVAVLPILGLRGRIARGEGLLLLAGYVGYIAWLFV